MTLKDWDTPLGPSKELGHGPWEKDYKPSGISRAEEAALKAYPDKEMNGVALLFHEQRRLFQEGYEQAEKDLALTWKDIMVICEHYVDVNYEYDYHSIQEKYEEILRRFKEARK